MAWFGRKKGETLEQPVVARPLPTAGAPGFEELADRCMDALAAVLRLLGKHGFDTGFTDQETFARRCESWARHVLTAAPVTDDVPEALSDPDAEPGPDAKPGAGSADGDGDGDGDARRASRGGRRDWRELVQWLREHRRDEQQFVQSRINELKEALFAFVEGLRDLVGTDQEMETSITGSLGQLEQAVQADSLEAVRKLVFQTMDGIRGALSRHRSRQEERLRYLGDVLRGLRSDLLEMRLKAELDPLTQLYNRGAFDSASRRYVTLSHFAGQSLCLLMIDLDHFKQVNDSYGHPAGDRVLRVAAAALLRAFPRRSDLVARYGGEEFVVLLHDADPALAERLGERALESVRRTAVALEDGTSIEVTCSIGLAELQADDTVESLVARADAALYRAKAAGRDRLERAGAEEQRPAPTVKA